jgi:hypothetical protein
MGARLLYGKVIDRSLFLDKGGKVHPALENKVVIQEAPGAAAVFLVLRAWSEDHGTFTEQWRLETPGGALVYESVPREIHLATETHVERLDDEVSDLELQYTADDYNVVFSLDEMEVARVSFPVELETQGEPLQA